MTTTNRPQQDATPRIVASPRARRALREQGVNPRSVLGTGPGGRITQSDVVRAAEQVACEAAPSVVPTVVSPAMTPMRRSIARITAASAATVPQFHLRAELDAASLLELRQQLIERVQSETRIRLSITDLLLRGMALALADNPGANAIWADGAIRKLKEVNLGLVVSLDDGLLIPTLRAVDRLTVSQLARRRSAAAAAARGGRVSTPEAAAASLSNLGTTRVDDFTAVIFPPQSTMLTAGRIVERPFVVDGKLTATPTLRLTLTVDHRVLDGAPAAAFLGRIVRYLEQPAMMLTEQARSK